MPKAPSTSGLVRWPAGASRTLRAYATQPCPLTAQPAKPASLLMPLLLLAAFSSMCAAGRVLKEYRRPRDEPRKKEASQYRCHPKVDSGWTRGTASGASYCCLYFARGIWCAGRLMQGAWCDGCAPHCAPELSWGAGRAVLLPSSCKGIATGLSADRLCMCHTCLPPAATTAQTAPTCTACPPLRTRSGTEQTTRTTSLGGSAAPPRRTAARRVRLGAWGRAAVQLDHTQPVCEGYCNGIAISSVALQIAAPVRHNLHPWLPCSTCPHWG